MHPHTHFLSLMLLTLELMSTEQKTENNRKSTLVQGLERLMCRIKNIRCSKMKFIKTHTSFTIKRVCGILSFCLKLLRPLVE